ncbi:TonB-dependent receptor [Echinicola sp. CAU 1574]|uniref:TonB-dependent receptor n=1 Tax=Echinicola arenosa TaxID=2774144 RepID=A0ABR9AK38_9BACT|nr:TonB-dependent receptor [Echinicola arenosa]MBD8489158.1 TonB-dependent receptor [Echinicola arenosa]
MKNNSILQNTTYKELSCPFCFKASLLFLIVSFLMACPAWAQKIQLKPGTRPLLDVIQEVDGQTNKDFVYNASQIGLQQNIRINVSGLTLESTLDSVFSGTGISHKIQNNHIVLVKTVAKEELVHGKVTDAETGEALVGVTVRLKGTSIGTATDIEGNFTLKAPSGATMLFTYIGYQAQELPIGSQREFSISLVMETTGMNEFVVVGYGRQLKEQLTGSISKIEAKQLEERPVVSTSAALQGLAPGVTVTQQTGAPGADGGQIRIRGINSFGGSDSSPLILIDGVAGNLNMIDVNQIESISVLKDAASAAIYGSRAANGVVLVTTKRASADKFALNYKTYVGKSEATFIPKVTDGLTFMEVFNEANNNDYGYPLYSEDEINDFQSKYAENPDNYDWQQAILNGSGLTQNHFLSLMANSDKIYVMPSISYTDQQGIIENTGFKRIIVRNNMDIKPSDMLAIKFDMSFNNSDRKQIAHEGDIWNYLGRMPTNIPIKRAGQWSEGWVNVNPVAQIAEGGNERTNNIELIGNLTVDVKPLEWLTLTGKMAPRYRTRNTHEFSKSIMTYNDDGSESGAAYTFTSLTETAYRYYFENYQFLTHAEKYWKNHHFKLLLGTSKESYDQKYLMGYRRDYTYDTYEVLAAGADDATKDNNGTHAQWVLVSGFGRLNYDFKDRYLFEANFRYDGSSRFSPENRWAAFPSFSAGWLLSEEPFMAGTRHFIDQIKIRGSWGQLGNQNIGSSYYPYMETLAVGSISMAEQIHQLVTLNTMSNPDLRWEETTVTDIGLDISLFDDHFSLTADWYKKVTDGILLTLYTSQLTGLNAPYQNAAVVENKGWELGANYDKQWGDFDLNLGFNLADVKNKITDMRGQTSGTLLRQEEGFAINSIYGYVADGLYQSQEEIDAGPTQFGTLQPGDIRYRDIAGDFDENNNPIPDGKINDDDKVMIGNTIPRYTYAMNLNLGWKGIKLYALFQGVGKVDGYLNSHYVIPAVNSSAVKTWQLDYWTADNTDAAFPRLSTTSTNNTQNSTYWMKSASYLRLKNLQVGYELPKKWLEKLKVDNVYLYANGQNLFTKTDFWQGYDPEVNYNANASAGVSLGSGAYYPQVKMYSLGLDIKF